jgi:hypothetical protein
MHATTIQECTKREGRLFIGVCNAWEAFYPSPNHNDRPESKRRRGHPSSVENPLGAFLTLDLASTSSLGQSRLPE